MQLKIENGNAVQALIDGKINILIHCANCQARMGSGIAKEIAERLPEAAEVDKRANASYPDDVLLGQFSAVKISNLPMAFVYNAYGQLYPGVPAPRPMNYGALAKSLMSIANDIVSMFGPGATGIRIGIPFKMASDRAGGDWAIVSELVEIFFADFDIVAYRLEQ